MLKNRLESTGGMRFLTDYGGEKSVREGRWREVRAGSVWERCQNEGDLVDTRVKPLDGGEVGGRTGFSLQPQASLRKRSGAFPVGKQESEVLILSNSTIGQSGGTESRRYHGTLEGEHKKVS